MSKKVYKAIIIGSGAAGYSPADWLYKAGITNVAVITEDRLSGTSRNTGSDKQTYYKLSLDGRCKDCAQDMACDIMAGGSCDGVLAYGEALNSVRCFMRLVDYGVPFPQDGFGGYPGYKTDHDNTSRATSVGPLTSKVMTEKLENVVIHRNKTPVFDGMQVVKLLVKNGRAFGVVAWNRKKSSMETVLAENVIAATGAPACVYEKSVFPESQHGMTGVLIDAGVSLCNFAEWQYGIASTDFRWNVSGSYMQVIPRLVSVDSCGNEREFLTACYESAGDAYSNLFLKGYQWPFSADRLGQSSEIDIAVQREIDKGNKVYLDYTRNPADFDFEALSDEAKAYLLSAGATANTPVERLEKLNSKAVRLYRDNGIDLRSDYLRVAVCAQHNNGGVLVDENYMSTVKGLYVIGEAAGVFGITRPGGTALNDTQVSGLVCAGHIKDADRFQPDEAFAEKVREECTRLACRIETGKSSGYGFIPKKMSEAAGFLRDKDSCAALYRQVCGAIAEERLCSDSVSSFFYERDMLISAKALLEAILSGMSLTGSRGGSILISGGRIAEENREYRKYLTVQSGEKVTFKEIRPVPAVTAAFESYLNEVKL